MSANSGAAVMSAVKDSGRSISSLRQGFDSVTDEGPEEKKQQSSPVPPISRLYRDALESVFDFLYVDDLSGVMAVSQSWSAAVLQKPCARWVVPCDMARLVPLCSSALSKHVNGIRDLDFIKSVKSELTCEALYTLAVRLPQILSIECSVLSSAITKVVLPPKLETLELDLSKLAAAAINTVLNGVSQLNTLSELKLVLPSFLPAISFALLAEVTSLKDLELSSAAGSQPTAAHLDQLRWLPQLRKMAVENLSGQSLEQLLRNPHALQWQEIHSVDPTDAVESAALSSLPSLTTLAASGCTDVSFLVHLPQLRGLNLFMAQKPWPATITADAVVDGLSCCTQLTDLTLTAPLNSKQLSVVLPCLPLLTELWFWCMHELESLECLSRGPVVPKLRCLKLGHCRHARLDLAELEHVYALLGLEKLVIENSFTEPLSSLDLKLHTPPSRVLPKLQEFTYIKPE